MLANARWELHRGAELAGVPRGERPTHTPKFAALEVIGAAAGGSRSELAQAVNQEDRPRRDVKQGQQVRLALDDPCPRAEQRGAGSRRTPERHRTAVAPTRVKSAAPAAFGHAARPASSRAAARASAITFGFAAEAANPRMSAVEGDAACSRSIDDARGRARALAQISDRTCSG